MVITCSRKRDREREQSFPREAGKGEMSTQLFWNLIDSHEDWTPPDCRLPGHPGCVWSQTAYAAGCCYITGVDFGQKMRQLRLLNCMRARRTCRWDGPCRFQKYANTVQCMVTHETFLQHFFWNLLGHGKLAMRVHVHSTEKNPFPFSVSSRCCWQVVSWRCRNEADCANYSHVANAINNGAPNPCWPAVSSV